MLLFCFILNLALVVQMNFSKSLIIHEEKTWERFGYVILIIIKFCELLLWISLLLMLWEAISNSRKSVSLHIQTLQSWLTKLSCASFFKPISQCLDIWWNTLPLVWYSTSTWKVNMGFGSTYSLDRDLCAGLHCPTLDQLGHEVHCLDRQNQL